MVYEPAPKPKPPTADVASCFSKYSISIFKGPYVKTSGTNQGAHATEPIRFGCRWRLLNDNRLRRWLWIWIIRLR
jgi:hypothetical protein